MILDHLHEVSAIGWTNLERRVVAEHRWWDADQLRSTHDRVFPQGLAQLLGRWLGVR